MIKIIKLDLSSDSFIYRKSTECKESKINYNDNDLAIHINSKELGEFDIETCDISKQYNGLYYYNYSEDIKLLLDDGYYDVLSRCGYIISDRYKSTTELSKDECAQILKKIQEDVSESIIKFVDKFLVEHPEYFYDHGRNMLIKLPVNLIGDSYPRALSDEDVEEILNKFAKQCGIISDNSNNYSLYEYFTNVKNLFLVDKNNLTGITFFSLFKFDKYFWP